MTHHTHHVRHYHTDVGATHVAISLPPVPGIEITADRSETAPRQPIICRPKPKRRLAGAVLQAEMARRAEWVRQALRETEDDA
ncbi:hypothetical protein [Gemmobacter denitrificans]|uniref:Uncharacterized protein n=1 Tax=Gemmobacter denitrificans TaxID=3123040 RepID=A0ABU8BSJ9_9RHOB